MISFSELLFYNLLKMDQTSVITRRRKSNNCISEKEKEGFINKLVADIRILSQYSESSEIKWKNQKARDSEPYQPTNVSFFNLVIDFHLDFLF
jgi:hypothetical protein